MTESDLDATGQTLAAAAGTRVEFWNVRTRSRTGSYTAPARVHQVALSADGRTAAVSTDDGYTRLLDVSGARLRGAHSYRTAKEDSGYWPRVAVSPRGTYLTTETTGSDAKSTLAVWDTRTDRRVAALTAAGSVFLLRDSSFSPDERVLSLPGSGGKPFTWVDTRTGKKLPFPDTGLKAGDIEGPVVFSPDGRRAAVTLKGGKISVFDRTRGWIGIDLTGAEDSSDYPLLFSPDGRYLVQHGVVWEVAVTRSGPVMRHSTTESECYPTTAPRFTADDAQLRCVGNDGVVRSYDVSSFTDPPKDDGRYYSEGAVSADRRTFALREGADIEIWSPLSRTRRLTVTARAGGLGNAVEKIQLSRDGRLLAVHSYTSVEIWDVSGRTAGKKGVLLGSLPVLRQDQFSGTSVEFGFAPDDRSLAVQIVTRDGTNVLSFWNLTTMRRIREVRANLGYPDDGGAVLFQPDGRSVIAAPYFGRVAFPSGRIVTKGSAGVEVDSFSDDGTTLYTHPRGFRPYIRFWDARTLLPEGEDLRTGALSTPLTAPERGTAVSPDGRLFATWLRSGPAYEIQVWDSRTGSRLGTPLLGPLDDLDDIIALAFTPDGSALVSVDQHGRFTTHTIAPDRLVRDLCAKSGPLTEREWKTDIPDIGYRSTC
ncbi:WD40 repeat domain-containing protein [Streptomyces sp. NPDC054770]